MAHSYNGSATGISPRDAVQVTLPDDGVDEQNAASVNTFAQKLADILRFLQSKAGLLDATDNAWSQTQSFLAAVAIALGKNGSQTIYKSNSGDLSFINYVGNLNLIAEGGGEASLETAGGGSMTARADGTMDANGCRVKNLAAPSGTGDATTKTYVDAAIAALAATVAAINHIQVAGTVDATGALQSLSGAGITGAHPISATKIGTGQYRVSQNLLTANSIVLVCVNSTGINRLAVVSGVNSGNFTVDTSIFSGSWGNSDLPFSFIIATY